MKISKSNKFWNSIMTGALIAGALGSTGCQITAGGQLLPSPYYIDDDVQYFGPGSEFKLQQEAAAIKAFNADQALQGGP